MPPWLEELQQLNTFRTVGLQIVAGSFRTDRLVVPDLAERAKNGAGQRNRAGSLGINGTASGCGSILSTVAVIWKLLENRTRP
jgi:hypothetical protein